MAIGENVRVWLSPSDPVPECVGDNANAKEQIMFYDNSNVQAGKSGESYSDIFVVSTEAGYTGNNGKFNELTGVQGNKSTDGSGYKDYIFLVGYGESYKLSGGKYSDGKLNNLSGIEIKDSTSGNTMLSSGTNHLEGVIYGDGLSEYSGDTEGSWDITLKIDIALNSAESDETLLSLTLHNIPEGATFSGDGLSSYTYDTATKSYTLTFDEGVTSYDGKMTIRVPDGAENLKNIVMDIETSAGEDYHSDAFTSDGGFTDTVEYDDDGNIIDPDVNSDTEEWADAIAMTAMADAAIDATPQEDVHTEDHTLQPTDSDDGQYAEDDTSTDTTDSVQDTADSSEAPQDTDAEHIDNPLADSDSLNPDNFNDGPDSQVTDTSQAHEESAETEEHSLSTLLDNTDGDTLHETETASEESHLNSESNESGQEATIIIQDEPLSFSDMIDGDNKDLSSLIQTTETTETAETPNDVEHVPAEGGDTDDNQTWASNDPDDLIAKPEVEA
ncbi:hypothetical protein M989_03053 [Kluyvera georgiana ATCC 51603]|uniref:Uncharacterized protein n=1 Tax=Kluyvera georgiana ATCC 51603 TaxID=1354264 RepID=A0A1B7JSZ9_9ENTR|nr:hypothetical protein M989_03053 [Kluyvera georgiana ATCC 51603]